MKHIEFNLIRRKIERGMELRKMAELEEYSLPIEPQVNRGWVCQSRDDKASLDQCLFIQDLPVLLTLPSIIIDLLLADIFVLEWDLEKCTFHWAVLARQLLWRRAGAEIAVTNAFLNQ